MQLEHVKLKDNETNIKLPVFLPADDGTCLVIGDAYITGDGDILIQLFDKDMPGVITDMMDEKLIKGISFDYQEAVPSD